MLIGGDLRTVRAVQKDHIAIREGYPHEIVGWHHLFYSDADSDACMIVEDTTGRIWDLYLATWDYQFTDRPTVTI